MTAGRIGARNIRCTARRWLPCIRVGHDFMTLRRQLDPQGVFLSAPMARLLGEE